METTILSIDNEMETLKANCSYYALQLLDYSGNTYICDAITEIADGNTSIYYSDIMAFIGNNPEAVDDAINEFGWDGCGRTLEKAGQMAEFLQIENEIYSDLETAIKVYALDYISDNYKDFAITDDMWMDLQSELENLDNNDKMEDITETVDNFMDSVEQKVRVKMLIQIQMPHIDRWRNEYEIITKWRGVEIKGNVKAINKNVARLKFYLRHPQLLFIVEK